MRKRARAPPRPGERLVEIKIADKETFIWIIERIVSGNHLLSFYRISQGRDWFRNKVAEIRRGFNAALPQQFDPAISEEIFSVLFPDRQAALVLTANHLIVIPDDFLFLLPFELLSPQARENRFLLRSKPITYYPSASALSVERSRQISHIWDTAFFAIGDPITDAISGGAENSPPTREIGTNPMESDLLARGLTLERLPGTKAEVERIAALFPDPRLTDILVGTAATKSGVLHTDLSRFRFIHFATQALLPAESRLVEPALVLSRNPANPVDMFLQMSEVLRLSFTADSVVLSACNTGTGEVYKAEGVSNLGRAFLMAGASSATVSLWQVADDSTALLMVEYYKGMLAGKSKAAALANARQTVINQGFSNPYYWAPFVLMGD